MNSVSAGVGFLVGAMLIPTLMLVFLEICLWKIYVKLGYPGWASLVPGYNLWIVANDFFGPVLAIALLCCFGGGIALTAIGGMLALVGGALTLIGSIIWMVVWYQVVRELGHGVGFFLGCLFLSVIFYPILAFEKY